MGPRLIRDLQGLEARRICIIKPSAFGDVVQSLPLVGVLNERFPGAHVAWVINRELAPLIANHPGLDDAIEFQRRGGMLEFGRLLRRLRSQQFDLVFDLQGLLRTAAMTWATRAKTRIGLQTAREGASLAYTDIVDWTSREVPAHLRYWRIAECLGLGSRPRNAAAPHRADDAAWAKAVLREFPRPLVAIHPAARWETKCWPPEKFAGIAQRVRDQLGGTVILVGSRGERPIADMVLDRLPDRTPEVIDLCGQTTLPQLSALLNAVDLLVCNDSGPMHLAAALETPVVGVFTCTDPCLSGPAGGLHQLISTKVECAGSYQKQCPHTGAGRHACFEELSTDRVWQGVLRALRPRDHREAA